MNSGTDRNKVTYVFTTAEAAEVLRISKNALYRLIHSGKLRSVRVGSKILIPREDLLLFLGQKSCYDNTGSIINVGVDIRNKG